MGFHMDMYDAYFAHSYVLILSIIVCFYQLCFSVVFVLQKTGPQISRYDFLRRLI